MQVSALGEVVSPGVLNNTPAVLSIGRRCMDEGYLLRWKAGQNPFLITPAGKKVVFEVDGYVPKSMRTRMGTQARHRIPASPTPRRLLRLSARVLGLRQAVPRLSHRHRMAPLRAVVRRVLPRLVQAPPRAVLKLLRAHLKMQNQGGSCLPRPT